MKQREIEQNNEAFFKDNSKAFIKLPAQLYKMLESAKDKDIGTIKFIPKTKEITLSVKSGHEVAEFNVELLNQDKPTLLFTETLGQKGPDGQPPKSEFDLELASFVKFRGNALKGQNEKIVFKVSTEPVKKTQKYDTQGPRAKASTTDYGDDWGRSQKSREPRREKQEKEVVEAKLFELFKQRPRWKFQELQNETREPKASLEEAIRGLCDTDTFEGKKYHILKPIYRFGDDQSFEGATPSKKVKKD